jgi:hypothetical protein
MIQIVVTQEMVDADNSDTAFYVGQIIEVPIAAVYPDYPNMHYTAN